MSDIKWRVGDTGVTRNGRRYEVTEVEDRPDYPIVVRLDGEAIDVMTLQGRAWKGEESESDLMPPTGGVTTLAPEQLAASPHTDTPPADREALVELSGRVLVALAGLPGRMLAADEAARWAADAARALLRECERP